MDLKMNVTYPYSDEYEYHTRLTRIDFDAEMENDIANNKGFIITSPQSVKKDLKNPDSIYSSRFGATMNDVNPFQDRYKCECGQKFSRIEHGTICPKCGTTVKFVGDDFSYFGYIKLNHHYVISPNLYKAIEFLIGEKTLNNIIITNESMDENGNPIPRVAQKDEPYYGLGMSDFKDNFLEIIEYYRRKTGKEKTYADIIKHKDIVFTHAIPVFTTLLRPFNIDGDQFTFEGTNALYNMMSKLASQINKVDNKLYRHKKSKDQLLYDLQIKWNELYTEIVNILSGKKGTIRTLFGGRYNFTSRDVIIGNNDLRVNQIILPYRCLLEWLMMPIINILETTYRKGFNYAYSIWYNASIDPNPDKVIWQIIIDIINDYNKNKECGFLTLLNRNPTINFGSILAMMLVGITDTYTLQVPLQILEPLAADFDGDVLNAMWIINNDFARFANEIYNPRNSLFIDRNDGNFNNNFIHNKDTIINFNTLMRLGRSAYSPENMKLINKTMSQAM